MPGIAVVSVAGMPGMPGIPCMPGTGGFTGLDMVSPDGMPGILCLVVSCCACALAGATSVQRTMARPARRATRAGPRFRGGVTEVDMLYVLELFRSRGLDGAPFALVATALAHDTWAAN
jgi:hypothetical protein